MIDAGLSDNTKLAYSNALKSFVNSRKENGLKHLWPVPTDHLELFLADLYNKGYSSKTASTFMSAISYHYKINEMEDTCSQFRCRKLLEGYRCLNPSKDHCLPIMYDTLRQIWHKLEIVCFNQYETYLFQAVFTLAIFGLFRVSELVWSSAKDPDRPLQMLDIKFRQDGKATKVVHIYLRKSKSNLDGRTELIEIYPVDSVVCPVKALTCYLKHRLSVSNILFCHKDNSPLTRYQSGAVLTKTLNALKINTAGYKSHSFRIGAASWLASQCTPHDVIKKMGHWSSNAFLRYIRI